MLDNYSSSCMPPSSVLGIPWCTQVKDQSQGSPWSNAACVCTCDGAAACGIGCPITKLRVGAVGTHSATDPASLAAPKL